MSNVWRFTGPPENWITAFRINNWALNENNKSLWENKIKPGDTVIFHSTKKSEFSNKTQSVVIGFGYVGKPLYEKNELWWLQEVRDNKNYWPYVVPLKEVYLFSDVENIDFNTSIQDKEEEQIASEIETLIKKGVAISSLNEQARKEDPSVPQFPVNGSASGINTIYEDLILEQDRDFIAKSETQDTEILEKKLAESFDERLASLSKEEVLNQAKIFNNSDAEAYTVKYGKKRVRKENQAQKRRVAHIEDYTCQVCSFKSEYTKTNGKKGWIIDVDHIIEKSEGGNENMDNLWALCPNCHAKKTRGVITVDLEAKKVYENGEEIEIKDNHLFI